MQPNLTDGLVKKPLGYSCFPKEIKQTPKAWAATSGALVWYRRHEAGGHLAALERPGVLFNDVEDFVAQVWQTEQGVVILDHDSVDLLQSYTYTYVPCLPSTSMHSPCQISFLSLVR